MTSHSLPFDRRTLVALLLVAALVPVAVWTTGAAITDDDPSVSANVSERYRSIETLNATRTVVVRHDATTTTHTVADVTTVPGTDRERVRFRNDSTRRYDLRVSNGSVLWLYDSDRRLATVIERSGPPNRSATADRVQHLVGAAGLTDDAGRPQPPDVEPLPVVPRAGAPPNADAAGGYTVEYVETDSVDGRDAYVLSITPSTNRTAAGYRQRLWIDTERFYPLRKQTTWTVNGTRRSVTTTYTDVRFDSQVRADAFRLSTAPETTVRRPETPDTEWYDSVSTLEAQSSIDVPRPSVPPAFTLTYATRTTGRIQSVGLRYEAEGRRLTVAKYNFTYESDPDSRESNLTVDGRPATLDRGPTTSLSWNCDRYRYTVRGTGVGTERLVAVAQSVGCPAA